MKFLLTRLLIVFTLGFISSTPAAEIYKFDPLHTSVEWRVNHLGFSNPSGKWFANGEIVFDKTNIANSKVSVIIQMASLVTGIPDLDKHLSSDAFFDVAKFPTASFVSTKIKMTSKTKLTVYGNLTLHGVTKPITLYMTINKIGDNIVTNKPAIGVSGHTTITRADYDINSFFPGLGDDADINIQAEAELTGGNNGN